MKILRQRINESISDSEIKKIFDEHAESAEAHMGEMTSYIAELLAEKYYAKIQAIKKDLGEDLKKALVIAKRDFPGYDFKEDLKQHLRQITNDITSETDPISYLMVSDF